MFLHTSYCSRVRDVGLRLLSASVTSRRWFDFRAISRHECQLWVWRGRSSHQLIEFPSQLPSHGRRPPPTCWRGNPSTAVGLSTEPWGVIKSDDVAREELREGRLDETARFLESRIESYNVHAHSTRLLRCSEVNEGCYSEVI